MGFIDDLGTHKTETERRSAYMTQDMSEPSHLLSVISQNESEINELYCKIGKLYVDFYKNDPEDAFAQMVETISELEKQNAEYRSQIQETRGVRKCVNCGAEVSKDAAFCTSCGSSISKPERIRPRADSVKCFRCGAWVKAGMRFCTSCGNPMTQPVVQIQMEEKEIICPNCGAEVAGDALFCSSCGFTIERSESMDIEQDSVRCAKCGALIKNGRRYCTLCGSPVAQSDYYLSEPEAMTESTEIICPNCGTRLMKDSVFCTECGIKLYK